MKLYYSPGACSMASHLVVNELALNCQLAKVDLAAKKVEQIDYKKVNSKGMVPALELENGDVLTEGAVIMQYLADQAPNSKLFAPPGTWTRYQLQELVNYIATEVHKSFSLLWNREMPTEAKALVQKNISRHLDILSSKLSDQPYLLGNEYTIADSYLFTILNWSPWLKFDLTPWPQLSAYVERIKARPATLKTLKAEGLM